MTGVDPRADDGAELVVVGGGVAGLVVARDAALSGMRVALLEASDRLGGLLQRADLGGVAIDLGAESYATRTTGVADLVSDAGLPLTLVAPAPGGAHLVTVGDDGIVRAPLPRRTVLGIPADPLADDVVRILGRAGAERVAAERTLPPLTSDDEPTLAELVAARCGAALAERLVDPLCRSVYSQPADSARLSRLHPALWRESVARGSLLAGADACASTDRAGSAVGGIVGGMWRLAAELERAAIAAGVVIRTGAPVHAITPGAGHILVATSDGPLHAAHVVVATGAAAGHALLGDPAPAAAAPRRVRVVAALVDDPAFDAHPVGSGAIVAPGVRAAAKALTHANAKWGWLDEELPAGRHLFRLSARDAEAPGLSTPADVAREIALLTGVSVRPDAVVAVTGAVYPDAVAGPPLDEQRRAQLAAAGIHLAGAAAAGTGLASVIPHARALAASLTSTPSTVPSRSVA